MKTIKSACIKQELHFTSVKEYEVFLDNIRGEYCVIKAEETPDGGIDVEINKAYNNSTLYKR